MMQNIEMPTEEVLVEEVTGTVEPIGKKNPTELLAALHRETQLKTNMERMKSAVDGLTPESDVIASNIKRLGITSENVMTISIEKLDEVYTTPEGIEIALDIPFDDEARALQFKREYLQLMIINEEAYAEYDREIEKINEAIGDDIDEARKLMADAGSFDNHVQQELDNLEAVAQTEEGKKQAQAMKQWYNHGLDSLNIIESIKKSHPSKFISEYKNTYKWDEIYKRHIHLVSKMGVNIRIINYPYIEKNIKGYEKYGDVFLYAVMRTIAMERYNNELHALYLNNLRMILEDIKNGTITEERKEKFYTGVKTVIDYYKDEYDRRVTATASN